MELHGNARTCPRSRLLIAMRVLEEGWPRARAAEAADVSVRTARSWLRRSQGQGEAGLLDRES